MSSTAAISSSSDEPSQTPTHSQEQVVTAFKRVKKGGDVEVSTPASAGSGGNFFSSSNSAYIRFEIIRDEDGYYVHFPVPSTMISASNFQVCSAVFSICFCYHISFAIFR